MVKYVLLGLYIIVLVLTGIVHRKNARTSEDFFLGGRGVGPILSAFAFVTTYISAVAVINSGKIGWGFGIGSLYNGIANVVIGIFLAWFFLGKRTREMSVKLNVMTMPDFLKARYQSDALKYLSALLVFIFMVPYSGSVFMGLSYIFESIFHIPYYVALIGMTILAGFYLTLGGYKAVATADAIQGIVMLTGSVMVVIFLFLSPKVGGPVEGFHRLAAIDPNLTSFSMGGWDKWLALIPIIMLTSIGPIGMPQLAQKFFAIKDNKSIFYATIVCTVCALVIIIGIHYIGFVCHLFFDKIPLDAGTLQPNTDLILPKMLESFMPDFALAVFFLLIISASMSTLAGVVMISASSIAMDLVKGYLKPDMEDRQVTLLMRILCIAFVVLSIIIAIMKPSSIIALQGLSWGAISGFFLAPYIYGLFWKGVTKEGALSGAIIGFLTAIVLPVFFHVSSIVACAAAMTVPFITIPVVSAFTPKIPREVIDQAFNKEVADRSFDTEENDYPFDTEVALKN